MPSKKKPSKVPKKRNLAAKQSINQKAPILNLRKPKALNPLFVERVLMTSKIDVTKLAQISVNTRFMRRLVQGMKDANVIYEMVDQSHPFDNDELNDLLTSCDIAEDLHAALIEDIGIENF